MTIGERGREGMERSLLLFSIWGNNQSCQEYIYSANYHVVTVDGASNIQRTENHAYTISCLWFSFHLYNREPRRSAAYDTSHAAQSAPRLLENHSVSHPAFLFFFPFAWLPKSNSSFFFIIFFLRQ